MLKSNPQMILIHGTDRHLLNELKRELRSDRAPAFLDNRRQARAAAGLCHVHGHHVAAR